MKTIFLTGGTGFAGSFMASKLLEEGYRAIFLARGKRGQSPKERIEKALKFANSNFELQDQYEIVEGDITQSDLGLRNFEIQRLKRKIDEIWHCAASISFREEEKKETYKINVEGTRNVLEFATKMQIPRLHYFSTAYVAGNRLGRVYEDELDYGQKFRNPYEETKFEAEKLVRKYAENNCFLVSIYRPSVMVGNSQSGLTPVFNGYYTFMRGFYVLRKRVYQQFLKQKEIYQKSGIFFRDGLMVIPGRVPCVPSGTINLVVIDWLQEVIFKLAINERSVGKTFHVVNQNPSRFNWLLTTSVKILGMIGFELKNIKDSDSPLSFLPGVRSSEVLKRIDAEILSGCEEYIPYISGEAVFDDTNVKKLSSSISHPPVTEELIKTLLDFAVATNFGRSSFKPKEIFLPAKEVSLQG